jgi:hypothetical protein
MDDPTLPTPAQHPPTCTALSQQLRSHKLLCLISFVVAQKKFNSERSRVCVCVCVCGCVCACVCVCVEMTCSAVLCCALLCSAVCWDNVQDTRLGPAGVVMQLSAVR